MDCRARRRGSSSFCARDMIASVVTNSKIFVVLLPSALVRIWHTQCLIKYLHLRMLVWETEVCARPACQLACLLVLSSGDSKIIILGH